jgi:hypothetical protein
LTEGHQSPKIGPDEPSGKIRFASRASFLGDIVLEARGHGGPINSPAHPPRYSREPIALKPPVVRTGKADLQCCGGAGFAALIYR